MQGRKIIPICVLNHTLLFAKVVEIPLYMEERNKIEITAFGKKIKALRKAKKWSQEDLGLEAGIDRTEVSRIENGLNNIEFYTIVKLASALNVEIRELFKP